MEKETEEQTLEKVKNEVSFKYNGKKFFPANTLDDQCMMTDEIAKLYLSERIKQLVPSEKKISIYCIKDLNPDDSEFSAYFKGFNKAIELLTKGENE